jgi:tetratricopeptide (TPR) repeat protein
MMLSLQDLPEAARLLAFAANSDGPQAAMARSLLETLGQAVLEPDPAYQLVLVGQRLADLGQWDIAEFAFQKAVASSPDYAEAWAMLGESRQHLGKDGWPDLLRARRIAPDSDIVLSALTLYWNRQNQPKVALVYLKKLAAKHPTEGKWQTEIGSTLAQSGDLIAAMTAFQQAVSIEPQNAQLWRNLAVFSAAYGFDFAAYSQPAIDRALSLAPKDARVLDAAGWIYLTNSDLKSAERFLQQAVAEDGGFAAAKLHLAQVYLAQNRFSIALPLLKEAAGQASDAGTALQAQRLLDQNFPGQ